MKFRIGVVAVLAVVAAGCSSSSRPHRTSGSHAIAGSPSASSASVSHRVTRDDQDAFLSAVYVDAGYVQNAKDKKALLSLGEVYCSSAQAGLSRRAIRQSDGFIEVAEPKAVLDAAYDESFRHLCPGIRKP